MNKTAPKKAAAAKQKTVRVIDRAVDIINCFDESHQRLTLQEISQLAGVNKTTAFRILTTLANAGLLTQLLSDNHFSLSITSMRMADTFLSSSGVRQQAWNVMQRLRDQLNETVVLAVRDGTTTVDVDQADADHLFESPPLLGVRLPFYKSAAGAAVLAALPKDDVKQYLEILETSREGATQITRLKASVAAYRSRGVIEMSASKTKEHTQLAVPLFNLERVSIAALYVSVPKNRLKNLPRCEALLKQAPEAFTRTLQAETRAKASPASRKVSRS